MTQTRWNDNRFTISLESMVWTASPVVRRYLHVLVSGDPNCDWLTYVCHHHLPSRVPRTLVLGCGSGWLERALAGSPKFGSIVACDFAVKTVARAAYAAIRAHLSTISYRVVDLEHQALPRGPFDLIIANDVLHHITRLESLYYRMHQALASDGRLIFNEYIGPNRFQYSDERVALLNDHLQQLPPHLRRDPVSGEPKQTWERVSATLLESQDPTEAVRAEEVLPIAKCFFEPMVEYPYGGGLLNPLLYGIVTNFREGSPDDTQVLQALCDEEARLTKQGAVPPDFHVFIGRPLAKAKLPHVAERDSGHLIRQETWSWACKASRPLRIWLKRHLGLNLTRAV
jgi:SAM-dependent methyltransferase